MEKRYKVSDITKQSICAALQHLMAQKPLEKITISEIMDTCGMRRQHFYYYFTDIYDLVCWMFEEEAISLLRRQDDVLLWQEGFLQLFQYLSENRAVCLCALESLGRESLKRFFETDINSIVRHAVRHVVELCDFPSHPEEEDMVARFLTIAMAGIVESWLRGELQQTPEELIRMFDVIFQDYVRGVSLRLKGTADVPVCTSPASPEPWRDERKGNLE